MSWAGTWVNCSWSVGWEWGVDLQGEWFRARDGDGSIRLVDDSEHMMWICWVGYSLLDEWGFACWMNEIRLLDEWLIQMARMWIEWFVEWMVDSECNIFVDSEDKDMNRFVEWVIEDTRIMDDSEHRFRTEQEMRGIYIIEMIILFIQAEYSMRRIGGWVSFLRGLIQSTNNREFEA